MQNVTTKVTGNILTITVDLSQRLGPSSTGKTLMVASTKATPTPGTDGNKFGGKCFAPIGGR